MDRKEIHGSFQLQRVSSGEIAEATIRNYYKATKLFCEMNGCAQLVNWKMIVRGMPRRHIIRKLTLAK